MLGFSLTVSKLIDLFFRIFIYIRVMFKFFRKSILKNMSFLYKDIR